MESCLHRRLSTTCGSVVPAPHRLWASLPLVMPKASHGALRMRQTASHPLQVLTDKKDFEALKQKPGKVVVDYMASW